MGPVVGLAEALPGDMGVDLGGGKGGMTEEGLHAAEVGTGIEEMGGEGMAQFVGCDVEGDVGVGEVLLEQGVD